MKLFRITIITISHNLSNSQCWYMLPRSNLYKFDRSDGIAKLIKYRTRSSVKQMYIGNCQFSSKLFFSIKNEMTNEKTRMDII